MNTPQWMSTMLHIAALACGAGGLATAQAQSRADEVLLYLAPAQFAPGAVAMTRFVFSTAPAIELGAFSFLMTWDDARAQPVESGGGSMVSWAAQLAPLGPLVWSQIGPDAVTGSWSADPAAPGNGVLTVSHPAPLQPMLGFQTQEDMRQPFVVTFQLFDMFYADGVPVDTGSGFFNSGTLTPVPEAATWAMWLPGAGLLALFWRRRSKASAGLVVR